LKRLGQLNQLSLQAYQLHLMALLISNNYICGLFPTRSDSSCLSRMSDIKRFRKEINQGIAKIMKCADKPAALEYILRNNKVFGKYVALDLKWRINKKKIKGWFFKIPMTYDIESCELLEQEFYAIYEERINSFHDIFFRFNVILRAYYSSVLDLCKEDIS